jgi:hypothetical protein
LLVLGELCTAMASKFPLTSKLWTPPAVKVLSLTSLATLKRADTVRLLAVVGLASALPVSPERSIRLKELGSVGVSTVMNKDLLVAW